MIVQIYIDTKQKYSINELIEFLRDCKIEFYLPPNQNKLPKTLEKVKSILS